MSDRSVGVLSTVLPLALLGVSAVAAPFSAWRRPAVGSRLAFPHAALTAGVPVALLALAAWFAVGGTRLGGHAAALAVAIATLAAVAAGGPLAVSVLTLADPRSRSATQAPTPDSPAATLAPVPGPADARVLRGGAWIGALERVAVFATLLGGWPEGLALVAAVKGLGRYPELRAPAAAERFIIGTLASILWSAGCAGTAALLVHPV